MKRILLLATAVLLSGSLFAQKPAFPQGQFPYDNPYAFGNDLSFVLQNEQRGAVFYDTDGFIKIRAQRMLEHSLSAAHWNVAHSVSGKLQ